MESSSSTEVPQPDSQETTDANAISPQHNKSRCSFRWNISNFSKCNLQMGKSLRSPEFKPEASEESMWIIELYPNGYKALDNDSMTIFIWAMSTTEQGILAEYSLSLLPANGQPLMDIANGKATFTQKAAFGKKEFMNKTDLLDLNKKYLPNDTLTIICNIKVIAYRDISLLSDETASLPTDDHSSLSSLSKDLLNLCRTEKFCDVTLRVGMREIKAHKAILSARSSVFRTMFEHQMQQNFTDSVDISDVEFETLERLVSYIYSGQAGDLTVYLAKNLFAIADKYAIGSLKIICSHFLMSNLTVDNSMEVLAFSDLYDEKKLKQTTMDFIIIDKDKVSKTAEWKSILKERPHLGTELLFGIITNEQEHSD